MATAGGTGSREQADPRARVGDWLRLRAEDPECATQMLRELLVRSLAARRIPARDVEDLADAFLLRSLSCPAAALRRWPRHVLLSRWVRGIARIAAAGWARSRQRHGARELGGEQPPASTKSRNEARRIEVRLDLQAVAGRLPVPHRQILSWRLEGLTRRDIAAKLARWRGVGKAETRRLTRETLRMARLLLETRGANPRGLWPGKFSEKNPWSTSPPPAKTQQEGRGRRTARAAGRHGASGRECPAAVSGIGRSRPWQALLHPETTGKRWCQEEQPT